MGGRAVECTGLENRRLFTEFVSSNLTLSAIHKKAPIIGAFLWIMNIEREMRTREVSSATGGSDAL